MQDNHFQEFDREIRSRLADAGIKPSRRVWKGVAARLDAAAAPVAPAARPWGWMRWAGLSLAGAAAIALGIFFSTSKTTIPSNFINPEQATLAQAGEQAGAAELSVAPAAPVPETVPAPAPVTRRAVRKARPARQDAPLLAMNEPAPAATPLAEEPAASVQEPSSEQTKPGRTGRKVAPIPILPIFDPFLEPIPTTVSKPRPALYAQGAVGSNEANLRSTPPTSLMAPGVDSGFSELGDSSFGIPFTVGLGIRFYVTPRLSISTGLDYSLLSRTFTGSYKGMPGSVSHTLQYIGIPANLNFDIMSSDRIRFYVYGGGEAEFCVDNTYRLFSESDIVRSYKVNDLQYSVSAGLGVEFAISRHIGLYLDPGVNYYFPCKQPRSIRTEKPFLLNFDVGLRFNL